MFTFIEFVRVDCLVVTLSQMLANGDPDLIQIPCNPSQLYCLLSIVFHYFFLIKIAFSRWI